MTGEVERIMRDAMGGAAVGGGVGGMPFGLAGTVMVGLEPIVFMASPPFHAVPAATAGTFYRPGSPESR